MTDAPLRPAPELANTSARLFHRFHIPMLRESGSRESGDLDMTQVRVGEKATRLFGDDYWGGGRVSFAGWGLNDDFGKLAAKSFEEAIENTLADFPPDVRADPNDNGDDLTLTFCLAGLGSCESGNGPVWQFSLMEALGLEHYTEEDMEDHELGLAAIAKSLRAVADHIEAQKAPMRVVRDCREVPRLLPAVE
jgi:hypothetical protein